jgi:hypothetical protein
VNEKVALSYGVLESLGERRVKRVLARQALEHVSVLVRSAQPPRGHQVDPDMDADLDGELERSLGLVLEAVVGEEAVAPCPPHLLDHRELAIESR